MKIVKIIQGHGDDRGFGTVESDGVNAVLSYFDLIGNPIDFEIPYIKRSLEIYCEKHELIIKTK